MRCRARRHADAIAPVRGGRFQKISLDAPRADTQIVLSNHGQFDLDAVRPDRGMHVMRDPRDMIVSGHHYHKRDYRNHAST